jgi:hypothetical protein
LTGENGWCTLWESLWSTPNASDREAAFVHLSGVRTQMAPKEGGEASALRQMQVAVLEPDEAVSSPGDRGGGLKLELVPETGQFG